MTFLTVLRISKAIILTLGIAFIPVFFTCLFLEVAGICVIVHLIIAIPCLGVVMYNEVLEEDKEKQAKAAFLSAPDGVEW